MKFKLQTIKKPNSTKNKFKTTRTLICDKNKLLDAPSNQVQAKVHSRMRLKDDLDPILINLSILEGISLKNSQVNVSPI